MQSWVQEQCQNNEIVRREPVGQDHRMLMSDLPVVENRSRESMGSPAIHSIPG